MSASPAQMQDTNRRFVARLLREHLYGGTMPPGWTRPDFIRQLQVREIPVPPSLLADGGRA